MARRLTVHKTYEPNSLVKWYRAVNPLKVVFNYIVITLSRPCPSLALKRWLLRRTGMNVGKNVSVGLDVMFDIFWPELITLKDNCILGYNSTILCHEFLVEEYRTGPVEIGQNVMIGANSTVLAGVKIGKGATVSACSLVNRDVAEGVFVGGVPAKELKKQI